MSKLTRDRMDPPLPSRVALGPYDVRSESGGEKKLRTIIVSGKFTPSQLCRGEKDTSN